MSEFTSRWIAPGSDVVVRRWECDCRQPPVLLGTYDLGGRVNIKVRDRYWHVLGVVWTHCPRCGREHVIDAADLAQAMHRS